MPHTPIPPRRTVALPLAVVRGLCALAALALLLVGVPWLLLQIGTLPSSVPTGAEARDALMRPDDGTGLMTLLTVASWIAWLWLTFPVLLEIGAVVARRTTPRLPGMGTGQRLAGFLLGSILLASPAAAASAATPAIASTAPHAPTTTATAAGVQTPAPPQTPATEVPRAAAAAAAVGQHTVGEGGSTWWELAEQFLGDGTRYEELQHLDPELSTTATVLPAGTTLRVPSDAATAVSSTVDEGLHTQLAAAAEQADEREHVVEPGDTLWGIAKQELGDGAKYPELFAATTGKPQPDGLPQVEDPDLIRPGQEITVPVAEDAQSPSGSGLGTGSGHHDTQPATPKSDAPDSEHTQTPDHGSSGPQESRASSHESEASSTPSPAHSPTAESRTPSQPAETHSPETAQPTPSASGSSSSTATNTPAPTSAGEAEQGDDIGSLIGAVGLAASGVFAAGILLTLGTRRLLQRRGLRRGNRIPMPTGRTATTELALRSVDASVELQLLDAMLRTAALSLAEQDGVLPELVAVRLGEQGVLLHLAEETEPVAPFTTADGTAASAVWWCPSTTDQLLDGEELREIDPPYPGLLALGAGDDNSIVLVDLEQLGAIHLTGERRQQVLRMAAITLALSPLGGQIELAVAGEDTAPGLTMLDQQRVTPHPDLARALAAFAAHQVEQQRTLTEFGPDGLAVARLEEEVEELWPMVLLADLDACPDPDVIGEGWELLDGQPYAAMAMLTSSTDVPGAPEDVWVVDTDAAYVTVPGTDVQCTLSGCSDDEYADVLELVLTADLPVQPDVPSPPAPAAPGAAADDETGYAAGAGGDEGVLLVKSTSGSASPTALSSGPVGPLAAIADLEDDPEDDDGAEETAPGPAAPAVAWLTDENATAGPRSAESANGLEPAREAAATDAPTGHGPLTTQPSESSGTVAPASLPLPRVSVRLPQSTDDSAVPAAAPSAASGGPVVRVLGAVGLDGAHGDILSNRKTTALELAAWLVLHPGANAHQVDEVLAPHGRISRDTRNSRIRELRKWLGNDADGVLHLPHIATQPDKLFRLAGVDCDWLTFQQLVDDRSGDDTARELRLKSALDLVGGRPFSGIPARRYVWAEDITQDIIKRIVHAADELAERRLQHGDGRSALWAANRGLHVAREAEQLWRHRIRAHALLGQDEELEDAIRALEALLLELGCSMDDETDEVLRLLQAARR
ncbi:LysM peptidoglycan-binding domain-containing protein [Streptomyces mirabilis]